MGLTSPTTKENRKQLVSNTPAEKKRDVLRIAKASEIKAFMDVNVDPCEDFYQFSCGNWQTINKARTEPTTGFFDRLSKDQSRNILEKLNETSDMTETETDQKVKRFFQSCVKLRKIPIVEHKTKLSSIIEDFGTMPALVGENWDGTNFDWLETIAKIQNRYGIEAIIGVDIMADFKNNSINRLYLGQAELALESKSIYLDEANARFRGLYAENIRNQLEKNLQLSAEVANATAWEIVNFEIELAKGKLDDKLQRSFDETTILLTADEMNTKYAPLDFKKFLKIIFDEDVKESIYEYIEEFQIHTKAVIENTPKKIVANYIFYKLVSEFFPRIVDNEKEQYELCEAVVNKHFAKNLDNMMYRQYNTNNTEQDVKSVWNEIKNSFKRELRSPKLNWISEETRQKAVEKLDAMAMEINSYNNTDFHKEFKDLELTSNDYINNMKNIYRHNAIKDIAKIHQLPEPFEAGEELSYTPANIILENKIKIPVSLLQPFYFWSEYYPSAVKFGTLGFLLGHEMIHGFDDSGRDYDKSGNQANWWDEKSTDIFINRTRCFTEQYHEYVFGGKNLPESEAQAENIADNGGLQIAYDAYLKWFDNAKLLGYGPENERLPRLPYTNTQLFFISFAQVWCSDIHPNIMAIQTATDEHTPEKFRVIGVLSNNLDFAKEFNCKEGSKMHPKDRCEIY